MKIAKRYSFCGAGILLSIGVLTASASDAGAAPETGSSAEATEWSTFPVSIPHNPAVTPKFKTLRVAKQAGFDRTTFEFEGPGVPGYNIRYTNSPAYCGSGSPVTVTGQAKLEVYMQPAHAFDVETGEPTYSPRSITNVKPNLSSVKELVMSCDGFEAETSYVIGVASMKNFRVLELSNPPRIVIDVEQ